jgi:hypothetical protein
LESFQISDNHNQANNDCRDGFHKEISYYGNCGLLFRGWSFECGQKVYGNISQYIDALANEMISLIPENAGIIEKSERILDSLKYNKFFNRKYLNHSMFKILGMLSEYNGRFNFNTDQPWPNYVESFSKDESELAAYFEGCILDYKNESHFDFEYKKIETNGHIGFESTILSKIINAFYEKMNGIATLNSKIFHQALPEYKLSYIESAYRRFGKKNRIDMSNSDFKIKTLARILKELGCTDIITYYYPSVPTQSTVFFMPSRQVKKHLKIEQILTKNDIQPELEAQKKWEKDLEESTKRLIHFNVYQLYFNPEKVKWYIDFRVPSDSHLKISIYNLHGEKIALLLDERYNPEKHDYYPWDTQNYTPGIYFFKLEVDGTVQTKKLSKIVLLK